MRSNDEETRQLLDAMDVCVARAALALDEAEAKEAGINPDDLGVVACMYCGAPTLARKSAVWEEAVCRQCKLHEAIRLNADTGRLPRGRVMRCRRDVNRRAGAYRRFRGNLRPR
ncbi:MAG TPA: hypothetical protein PLF11_01385 [Bacillota bacterium]|jgi:hypothetical protein|nr:hypothetical protein [Bacillota bacterium]